MGRCDTGVEDGVERTSQRRRLTDAPSSDAEDATTALDGGPSAAALSAIVTLTPAFAAPRALTDALMNIPSDVAELLLLVSDVGGHLLSAPEVK